jgi:hypothetical protein
MKHFCKLVMLALLLSGVSVSAQTIKYVKQGGTGSGTSWADASGDLQAMINGSSAGNEVWVAAGTYQRAAGQSFSMKEAVKIYGGFSATGAPVMADRDWDSNITTLQGSGNNVINNSYNGLTALAVLDGFTITGGNAQMGGGIYNNNVSPSMSNLTIKDNLATVGGGMFNNNSYSLVNNCIISNNNASFYGGGIFNLGGSPVFNNVIINYNSANSGGGICNDNNSAPRFTNIIIKGNQAKYGGGMYNVNSSSPSFVNAVITENTATTQAAAIYNSYSSGVFTNIAVTKNSSPIANVINQNSSVSYNNATISSNAAEGGMYNLNAPVQIYNSIIYGNTTGLLNYNSSPQISHSLVQGSGGSVAWNTATGTDGGNNMDANPMFNDPANDDYTLQSTSPAINSGSNSHFAGAATATDLSGNPRIYSNTIDMGAYEVQDLSQITIRYVKQGGTGNGYSWAAASGNLQAMINESSSGNEVWVAAGTYQPASGQSFSMKEAVKIYGGFAATGAPLMADRNWYNNITVLQGNGNSVIRNNNNGLTVLASLDGFTITAGNAQNGGGIYNNSSSPSLINLTISENYANGNGGGIYNDSSSSPVLTNVIISANRATWGGGINNSSSSPVSTNVIISGNYALYFGGGIYNYRSQAAVTNVTISGNNASVGGGAIFHSDSPSLIIRNSIVYNNSTGIEKAGSSSAHVISYSLIQGHTDTANGNISGDNDPRFANSPLYTAAPFTVGDYRLQYTSQAINSGSNSYFAGAATATDLSGNPRIYSNTIDMGAYEVQDLSQITTRYVRQGGTGNGYSWAGASGDLQAMINESSAGNEVWVAAGTYTPPAGTSFSLKSGVAVYGGFAATGAPVMAERNYSTNLTILQGNNSRVLSNTNISNTAVLDGFVIQAGTLTGSDNGAGISNTNSAPVIRNCIIRNNTSQNWGGGIFNVGADARPNIINCLIYGNSAGGGGGTFDYDTARPVYINCTIANNHSLQNGGGMHTYQNVYVSLRNSIIWGNTCGAGGKQLFSSGGGGFNTYDCTVAQGSNDIVATYSYTILLASGPLFTNPAGGDFTLQSSSPAINAGNNALYPNAATAIDLAGNPRLYNSGTIDMGAYEYQGNQECYITTTWNGSSWSNGAPVSNAYNAVIAGSYTSAGNLTACSLTVNSGTVTVNSGHNFIIKGTVTVAGGSLTFEDNANLVQADNVANSGSITYKKMSSELHNLDYTIWSSPTTGTQTLKQYSPQTLDERFYVYNTALGLWSNHTSASGIFGGTPATVTFTKAKGYMVRMPAGLPANGTSAFEGTFTGVPNNGDIAIAAPAGFNAVGNPYPSPINIHNFIDANAGTLDNDGTLYFWRKTNNTTATTYATINKIAYVKNTAEGGDTGTGYFNAGQEANWVINPGQGFFVKSLGGSIDFKNSMRRALNNGQFFRSANTQSEDSDISRYWLNIKGVGGSFGEMAVAYTAMATTALDYGLDGRLVNDGAASVYSLSGTTKLAIQARPSFIDTDVVPLGFKATTAGSYTISLTDDMDGLFKGNQEIYLRDKITAVVHNLKQGDYSFTTAEGTFNSRFEVIYTDSALGIQEPELADSTLMVYKQEGSIYIDWKNEVIGTVTVFDIRGRVIYQNKEIGRVATVISQLTAAQQVLLVQVTTEDNRTATKKITF